MKSDNCLMSIFLVAILMTRIIQTMAVKVCLWGGPMGRRLDCYRQKEDIECKWSERFTLQRTTDDHSQQ